MAEGRAGRAGYVGVKIECALATKHRDSRELKGQGKADGVAACRG